MRTFPVALLLAAALTVGCGGRDHGTPLTKDEARQLIADGKADDVDFCADYGWYGDGQCDDWCPAPGQDPDCTSPSCPLIFCALACDEYQQDENGCPICACVPDGPCPPVACMLYCEHGFKQDAQGCDVCECAPAPGDVPCGPATCAAGQVCCNESCGICTAPGDACTQQVCGPQCQPQPCTLACEYGFKQDAQGCDVCECAPPPGQCQPQPCTLACEYGFKQDANGCDLCECAPAPGLICGGYGGLPCPSGLVCIDDPTDTCDPGQGHADCLGICVAVLP